jgi:hypothetical protein
MAAVRAAGEWDSMSGVARRVGHWTLVIGGAFRIVHGLFVNNPG